MNNSLGNKGIYGKYSDKQPLWNAYKYTGSTSRYFYNAQKDSMGFDKPVSLISYLLKLIIPSEGIIFSLFLKNEIKYCIEENKEKNWKFMEVDDNVKID